MTFLLAKRPTAKIPRNSKKKKANGISKNSIGFGCCLGGNDGVSKTLCPLLLLDYRLSILLIPNSVSNKFLAVKRSTDFTIRSSLIVL